MKCKPFAPPFSLAVVPKGRKTDVDKERESELQASSFSPEAAPEVCREVQEREREKRNDALGRLLQQQSYRRKGKKEREAAGFLFLPEALD